MLVMMGLVRADLADLDKLEKSQKRVSPINWQGEMILTGALELTWEPWIWVFTYDIELMG